MSGREPLNVLVVYDFFEHVSSNLDQVFSAQLSKDYDVTLLYLEPIPSSIPEALEQYKLMIRKHDVRVLLCNEDSAMITASILKKDFPHLKVPDFELVFLCQHKYYTHKYLDTSPTPIETLLIDCTKCDVAAELSRVEHELGFPCVLKPCLGTTSYGVFKCSSRHELRTALEYHLSDAGQQICGYIESVMAEHVDHERFPLGSRHCVLVQKLMPQLDGARYTLYETEYCLVDGEVIMWPSLEAVYVDQDREQRSFFPAFQMPLTCSASHQAALEVAVRRDARRLHELGFGDGFVHGEYFMSDAGEVRLLELNPRLCAAARGMYIRALGQQADNYSASILLQLGKRPANPPSCSQYALSHYISSLATGPADDFFRFEEQFAPQEIVFNIDRSGEMQLGPGVDFQHVAYLNLIGENFAECRKRLDEIRRCLIKKPQLFPWRYLSEQIELIEPNNNDSLLAENDESTESEYSDSSCRASRSSSSSQSEP